MKDVFVYLLISLNFGLINGWDIKFDGYKKPIVITVSVSYTHLTLPTSLAV